MDYNKWMDMDVQVHSKAKCALICINDQLSVGLICYSAQIIFLALLALCKGNSEHECKDCWVSEKSCVSSLRQNVFVSPGVAPKSSPERCCTRRRDQPCPRNKRAQQTTWYTQPFAQALEKLPRHKFMKPLLRKKVSSIDHHLGSTRHRGIAPEWVSPPKVVNSSNISSRLEAIALRLEAMAIRSTQFQKYQIKKRTS